eukprot:9690322-Alexandrium_andersonii.AAC.1
MHRAALLPPAPSGDSGLRLQGGAPLRLARLYVGDAGRSRPPALLDLPPPEVLRGQHAVHWQTSEGVLRCS